LCLFLPRKTPIGARFTRLTAITRIADYGISANRIDFRCLSTARNRHIPLFGEHSAELVAVVACAREQRKTGININKKRSGGLITRSRARATFATKCRPKGSAGEIGTIWLSQMSQEGHFSPFWWGALRQERWSIRTRNATSATNRLVCGVVGLPMKAPLNANFCA
jgi:hypothetical protein